ncbi:hypothetical protein [Xanthomonas arboricola]|uniref:hypothetical protein n=1 Tax=Xanthomonas arboricola TaxID=56448 RepID=UPI00158624C1|nr:hypothetical protein [Xanthomonas arboricola]MDN0268966.1 hypothetical protein [Xanthomonas arboricola pv. pruni]MDN0273127.1 hypothetical protein [Xanthomonas arboricola pv. pruni]MDN0281609.1 hypothetical protein [Xanthomonas arboricola pv. pruni]MDN0306307.1 hypothetical protein [Xanthomonas arboricola pv. pruni]UJO10642.1 hypothetical protein K9U02_15730 [Xanthomonas arboricola pv. pruni]
MRAQLRIHQTIEDPRSMVGQIPRCDRSQRVNEYVAILHLRYRATPFGHLAILSGHAHHGALPARRVEGSMPAAAPQRAPWWGGAQSAGIVTRVL